MPRPPKNKVVEAAKPSSAPPRAPVIDVDNFIRVRDSVYQRLSTIQDLIKSFSNDYLRQTNLLLGEGTNIENGGELDSIAGALSSLMPAAFAPPLPVVEEKKERKKRTHDPNAPKRPLTPYFLYMQTARPIIASDLGEEAPKGAVQEEGQRRWSVMGSAEKQGWNTAYQYNLRLYNARVHSYKHGNPDAKNMSDPEALKYADEFNIEMPTATAVVEEEPTPAAKTPKKGKDTRKRKTATPAAEAEPAKIAPTPSSPEVKKRKRTSKAAEVEEPKKSGRKKSKTG
ncbi:hypothetical protein B0T26DRAFT_26899 [Lasiosphaeria miniovina]|uniref:HMG box domain-containing protein n=1 Tax=Lasiosphaeria miniovina TaxID=1954250 RepID=A0AA40EDL7_9PEZI|nr:uncharacterized protein B0T26DRAFT_26899 [Lasiosphaeria miniovina]KAK0733566.1 hypothetical protein B0T26DRAFT_26899 [Lasiosphaeria miniovina]